jgi:hypothetical protein
MSSTLEIKSGKKLRKILWYSFAGREPPLALIKAILEYMEDEDNSVPRRSSRISKSKASAETVGKKSVATQTQKPVAKVARGNSRSFYCGESGWHHIV